MGMKTLRRNDKGDEVKVLQCLTGKIGTFGEFDKELENHIVSLQKTYHLTADGIVGPKTWEAIASHQPTLRQTSRGNEVRAVQFLVGATTDGIFGKDTRANVRAFQSANSLTADGIVGKKTWHTLLVGKNASAETQPATRPSTSAYNSPRPVHYKQYDSKWAKVVYTQNNTYNRNQTIRSSGCGITCGAMIGATWYDKNITPPDEAKIAVQKGYRTPNSGTSSSYFRDLAKRIGADKYITTGSAKTAHDALLNEDYEVLVVANVGPSIWTKGGHYILAYKLDANDNVYINDPASSASKRQKNTWKTLVSATKGWYIFMKKK